MPDQLLVRLVQATNLRDAVHFGVQDPYVSVAYGNELKRSKVCKGGGVSPKWEETITFDVFDQSVSKLRLSVETKKFLVMGELIGAADVSLTEVYQTGTLKQRIPLITKDERQRGEIEIVVKYGDLLNGCPLVSVSTAVDECEDEVVDDLAGSQPKSRGSQASPMLATMSDSSWGGSGRSRDSPCFLNNGPTSPQGSTPGRVRSQASAPSNMISSPSGPSSARQHTNAPRPSHQQPESSIFVTPPPDHIAYPTVVQISPPAYPLSSSGRNNWASQESLAASSKESTSEDLNDGVTRSVSLDSSPSDAQVAAAEKQKEFRARLEALRKEAGRSVNEENEGDGGYTEGFFPEVKYKGP